MSRKTKCPLYYWRNSKFCNFGDELSRLIVERIAQSRVETTHDRGQSPKLLAVGSILQAAVADDIVWGAGTRGGDVPLPKLEVFAVRGPLTQAHLKASGVSCPDIFGDPALLLPKLFPELKWTPQNPIGHVIHFGERYVDLPGRIDVTQPPLKVLREILKCEVVMASSLHGVIVADAFGIPVVLLDSQEFRKMRIKYEDYFLSTGRSLPQVFNAGDVNAKPVPKPIMPNLEALLAAFPSDRILRKRGLFTWLR